MLQTQCQVQIIVNLVHCGTFNIHEAVIVLEVKIKMVP